MNQASALAFHPPPSTVDKSYTRNDSSAFQTKRLCIKIDNVFSKDLLLNTNSDIDRHPVYEKITDENISFVKLSKFNNISSMPIVFNGNGEVEDWSHLDTCLPEATANMKQLVKDSIIRVADTIELKNVKASIKTLFIRYDLTANSPSIRNLTWHYDDCSLTLTTLISDYQQGNISFSGGELNFAKAKYPMHSKELHDSLWKGEIDYDPQTIRTFKYPYNGGFFFDNIDTRHKVSDIIIDKSEISSECAIERRIFSLFLKFNKEALDKILVENQAKSEF